MSETIINEYYNCFNSKNYEGMLATLHADIRHDINQGETEVGIEPFRKFLDAMEEYGDEQVTELVIFTSSTPNRAAAEFTIKGTYKKTFPGFPEASGQKYTLPVGAFFELKDKKISRVTVYYNMQDWVKQVK